MGFSHEKTSHHFLLFRNGGAIYGYDATDFGGRLRISSGNREAITAVHDFLRFQISDHETGDSTEVTAQK
jgi:hypothetical protein